MFSDISQKNKFLYCRNNLYKIIKEDAYNYNLERFNKVTNLKHMTPINFKIESANNYNMFLTYDKKQPLKNNILFQKTQRDFILIDQFNLNEKNINYN